MSHVPKAQPAVRAKQAVCIWCGAEHETEYLLCPTCNREAGRYRKVQDVPSEPDD